MGHEPHSVGGDAVEPLTRRIARDLHMLGALTRELLEGDVSSGRAQATFTQVVLLRWLDAGGPRRSKLIARFLGVSAPATSQIVTRLKRKGLVLGRPDPTDGRAELLGITPRGRAFVERHRQDVQGRMEALLVRVPAAQRRSLAEGLEAVIELLLSSGVRLEHLCLHCHALSAPGCLMRSHGRRCPTEPGE